MGIAAWGGRFADTECNDFSSWVHVADGSIWFMRWKLEKQDRTHREDCWCRMRLLNKNVTLLCCRRYMVVRRAQPALLSQKI